MRELKFRYWDGDNMIDFSITGEGGSLWERYGATDNENITQYTGLKDKNGKEIYEGDILSFDYTPRSGSRVVEFISEPQEIEGGFGGTWTGYDLDNSICTVIGNIYENPDLIKQ